MELSSSTAANLFNIKGARGNNILYVSGSGNIGINSIAFDPLNQNVSITGNTIITGSIATYYDNGGIYVPVIDGINGSLYGLDANIPTQRLDWVNRVLYGASGFNSVTSLHWGNRNMFDSNTTQSINWNNRTLHNTTGTTILNWNSGINITGSTTISGSLTLTGSLFVSSSSELSSSIQVSVSSGSSSTNMGVALSRFVAFDYIGDQTNIYTDKYIQISYDTSGEDPELTILTGPTAGRVQVHLFNTATAAESTIDMLNNTLTDIFSTGLLIDTRLDCTISAGDDTNWPFYRMTWFRSNTTYGGNIQVLIERFFK